MAKAPNAKQVEAISARGRHPIGNGLYLIVEESSRRWFFRFQIDGKRREMGLGPYPEVSLAEARAKAAEALAIARGGVDPIHRKKTERLAVPTFGDFTDELIESIEAGFRNEKHRAQWAVTLGKEPYDLKRVRIDKKAHASHTAALTALRAKLISDVDTADVLTVLKPIWQLANETASRVRGRIEKVLDAAKAKGFRSGENPAAWRGHLVNLLPRRQKLTRGHHAAMPYDQVPGFIAELRQREAVAARALEFAILTAARSGEVLGATWGEIDNDASVWTIPAARMKAGREHRVPLTKRALEILAEVKSLRRAGAPTDPIFPGTKTGRGLSATALEMILRRMKQDDATPHGFRSSFRDWAGEETSFPREVAEAALAHVVGDETERAYRRGDALAKRRALMTAWADFIEPKAANV